MTIHITHHTNIFFQIAILISEKKDQDFGNNNLNYFLLTHYEMVNLSITFQRLCRGEGEGSSSYTVHIYLLNSPHQL